MEEDPAFAVTMKKTEFQTARLETHPAYKIWRGNELEERHLEIGTEDVVEISDGKLALMQETECEVLQGPFKDELTDAMQDSGISVTISKALELREKWLRFMISGRKLARLRVMRFRRNVKPEVCSVMLQSFHPDHRYQC